MTWPDNTFFFIPIFFSIFLSYSDENMTKEKTIFYTLYYTQLMYYYFFISSIVQTIFLFFCVWVCVCVYYLTSTNNKKNMWFMIKLLFPSNQNVRVCIRYASSIIKCIKKNINKWKKFICIHIKTYLLTMKTYLWQININLRQVC